MKDFKKERGRSRQYLRVGVGLAAMAVLALVAFGSVRAAWSMYQKFTDASAADAAAQSELSNMQEQYQSVSTTVQALNTSRGLEAAIRGRYGVGRPGEGEIDIVPQAATSTQGGNGPQNWFERLWHAIVIW